MISIVECISGLVTAITLVTEIFVSVSAQDCTLLNTTTGKLYLDCANTPIDSVPQTYDSRLEIMNISHTEITFFLEDDFNMYSKLKVLEMKGLFIETNGIPNGLFTPLTQLELLDLSGTNGDYKFPEKLPNSIKYLYVNEYDNEKQLDLTMLDKLVELHMAQSTANNLPKLNQKAPMVVINIFKSEGMEDLHYNQLAPFCLLKIFKIDHHTQLTQPKQLEQCCGILSWAKTYNIKGVDFYCSTICSSVNVEITSAATNIRHECLVRHGLALDPFWIRVLIGLIAAIIFSFLGYLGYRLYSRFLSESAVDHFVATGTTEEEENLSLSETSETIA